MNKPKQRSNPLSAGDGRPALMRQAREGCGKMGDTEKREVEREESRRKMFEVIREEHYFKGDEEQAMQIIELLLRAGELGVFFLISWISSYRASTF